ncbi:cellobiose dehydrogenase [Coprinopsis sp. MPI-PUGE-AT-0042]|nr:cellobiose dehydrogenase [Coprinopsis sp. MPI-PUGE-AT-0042]
MPSGCSWLTATTILLGALTVNAQDREASEWCDDDIETCFQRYYDPNTETAWGYLFPPASPQGQPPRNEFIGIFTGPVESGWIGNSLGGQMRSNPLVVGWLDNDNKALVSIRFTDQLLSPDVFEGPELTVLGTSGSNGTHQRIVYRCQNCTQWTGGTNGIPSNGTAEFGYAGGSQKPPNVTDVDSSIPQHSIAGLHDLDVSAARSSSYNASLERLVAAPPLTPPDDAPTPTSSSQAPPASTGPVSCPGAPAPRYPLNVAKGWGATPILGGLSTPRGIILDSEGHPLVLERGIGVTGHTLDSNGCVTNSTVVVEDDRLNHAVDVVGTRLVASSSDIAWSWEYNPATLQATNRKTLVTGMDHPGHVTRTLLISRKNPDYIVVSVGSDGNIDEASIEQSSGTAQIRVFDMRNLPQEGSAYTDERYGKIMGFGLRNDVGMTEDRAGIVHSIENSADNVFRIVNGDRRDIHADNPAEKVYNLGSVTSPSGLFGGYPICLSTWQSEDFKDGDVSKKPGDWFVQDTTNGTFTDGWCETNAKKPTVLLPPHTAPLDMKFGVRDGDANMYASLHGSWNRQVPIGYKVVAVPGKFSSSGEWSPRDSLENTKNSIVDILANREEGQCQKGCFRPVGLVFDESGERLYVSSDTSGEVFLVKPGENAAFSAGVRSGTLAAVTLLSLFSLFFLL